MKIFAEKEKQTEESDFRERLLSDLEYVTNRLARIRESYDMTAEPEMVESLIYEEKAMNARFDYLIRVARERNIKCRLGLRK
ncbi:MAG: YaaL family protein [Ruminococcus sp.]|nr:YaaL family protein [Ruminococcus sp.]MCM1380788.1 YaaL family protein [Muribaculaceae bacterium]MCM1478481.1 YaaL family protein [Muribaculaceae bacterium]